MRSKLSYFILLPIIGLLIITFPGDMRADEHGERPFMGFPLYPTVFMSSNPENFLTSFYQRSDVISIHWDAGVPWAIFESCEDIATCTVTDAELQATLDNFRQIIAGFQVHTGQFKDNDNQRVYLALNPLNIERDGISPDYELPGLGPPGDSFDDEHLRSLYHRFVNYMVDAFEPDFFSPGIEITMYTRHRVEDFENLVSLMRDIRDTLKVSQPDLIIAPTIQWEFLMQSMDNDPVQAEALADMLENWDSIGDAYFMSTYPNIFLDRDSVDASHYDFERYGLRISADTPLYISEAGTQEQLQVDLLTTLTDFRDDFHLQMLIWFFLEDFSHLPLPPGLANSGLYDDSDANALRPRPGLAWWDEYSGD